MHAICFLCFNTHTHTNTNTSYAHAHTHTKSSFSSIIFYVQFIFPVFLITSLFFGSISFEFYNIFYFCMRVFLYSCVTSHRFYLMHDISLCIVWMRSSVFKRMIFSYRLTLLSSCFFPINFQLWSTKSKCLNISNHQHIVAWIFVFFFIFFFRLLFLCVPSIACMCVCVYSKWILSNLIFSLLFCYDFLKYFPLIWREAFLFNFARKTNEFLLSLNNNNKRNQNQKPLHCIY